MKYLFCTDGSDNSFAALSKVLCLSDGCISVDILHVIHQSFLLQKLHPDKNFEQKYEAILKKIIEKSKEIIKKHACIEGEKIFLEGSNNKIIEYVQANHYGLIIAGSHGYKGVRNQIGSTSRKIVEKSKNPVFIARPDLNKEIEPQRRKRFLVCVDESFQTAHAIEVLLKLFDVENSDVSVVTVSADIRQFPVEICSDSQWIQACLDEEVNTAKSTLKNVDNIFQEHGLELKNKIHLKGDIAEEILNYAKENSQDVLILGSHCRTGIADFLLGSVSKRVLDYSSGSILIIPSKK